MSTVGKYVKQNYQNLKKVKCFSDGCAAQSGPILEKY